MWVLSRVRKFGCAKIHIWRERERGGILYNVRTKLACHADLKRLLQLQWHMLSVWFPCGTRNYIVFQADQHVDVCCAAPTKLESLVVNPISISWKSESLPIRSAQNEHSQH
eukprot:512433-Amphidinium_carterae.1